MVKYHSLISSRSLTFTPSAAGELPFIPKLQKPNRKKRKLNLGSRAGSKEKHSWQTGFTRFEKRPIDFFPNPDVQSFDRKAIFEDVEKPIKCNKLKSALNVNGLLQAGLFWKRHY
jgi:hypothetical protein